MCPGATLDANASPGASDAVGRAGAVKGLQGSERPIGIRHDADAVFRMDEDAVRGIRRARLRCGSGDVPKMPRLIEKLAHLKNLSIRL